MLQSQIDYLKEEIDELKKQLGELRDTVETLKPAEPELPWKNAPKWAHYAAMDEDGEWWWHNDEPYIEGTAWISPSFTFEAFYFPSCTNWKESKRKRP